MMKKSAVLWFDFLSTPLSFGHIPSSVALQVVGNVTSFVSMKEKVNTQKNLVAHARPRGNGNRSLSAADDWCHAEK